MKEITLLMAAALSLLIIGCSEQKATAPAATTPNEDQTSKDLQIVLDQNVPSEWTEPQASPIFQMQLDSIDTSYDIYVATFVWGNFVRPNDTITAPTPTDWSGTLNFNAVGGIKTRSVICFEKGQDSLLPRPDSATIAWASTTFRDFDGINIVMLSKRGVTYFAEPRLAFSTVPFSLEIPLSGLVRFSALYKVDDHNGIAIFARQIPRPQCPKGMIMGVWHRDSTWENGPFEGFWVPASMMPGPPMPPFPSFWPKVYGKFFTTPEGKHLFAGKYTDTTGAEKGELYGEWYYDDPTMCMMCGAGHAVFKGRFTINGVGEVGDVFGEIGFGPGWTEAKMNMPVRGLWRFDCPTDRPNDETKIVN